MNRVIKEKGSSSVRSRVISGGKSNGDDSGDFSKTVENALVLLNTIALLGPVSLGDLASELHLNRTVTHRLLVTLMRQSFVLKFANTYVVGPAVLKIGESVLPAFRRILTPTLRRIAAQTRETVSCAVRDGSNWVILDQVLDDSHGLHVREELGTRYPLYLGAHGHALLAALSDDELEKYYAGQHVSDEIKSGIEAACVSGYAVSRGELRDGITGIAVTGMFQDIPFSLGVIIPSVRAADTAPYIAPLLEAVAAITSDIQ